MRRALLIGIDQYTHAPQLTSCVNDTKKLEPLLSRNEDCSVNFQCQRHEDVHTNEQLEGLIETLFDGEGETALFYFSGHGARDAHNESYIVPANARTLTDCLSLTRLLTIVNYSKFQNRVVILDSCYSGAMGTLTTTMHSHPTTAIGNGVTILTSSRDCEVSMATPTGSTFTNLLLEALNGSAADVRGNITTGSIYAYIDQALGAWGQRPLYKTNISHFNLIRKVKEAVPDSILQNLTKYFAGESTTLNLNPSFEWTNDPSAKHKIIQPYANAANVKAFKELQQLSYNGLVVPVGESCMYDAAMNFKGCKLTELGKQYWRRVHSGLI